MKIVKEVYIHKDDDDSEVFDDIEFQDIEAEYHARNWAYEILFKIEIDTDTGNTQIIEIDDGSGWKKVNV